MRALVALVAVTALLLTVPGRADAAATAAQSAYTAAQLNIPATEPPDPSCEQNRACELAWQAANWPPAGVLLAAYNRYIIVESCGDYTSASEMERAKTAVAAIEKIMTGKDHDLDTDLLWTLANKDAADHLNGLAGLNSLANRPVFSQSIPQFVGRECYATLTNLELTYKALVEVVPFSGTEWRLG